MEDVSRWIHELTDGDAEAAQRLWQHYCDRLIRLASRRLGNAHRAVADEEDVALSAFNSFLRGAAAGRFPRLEDRDDLWRLLVTITARKALAQRRRQRTKKRGAGRVRGESAFMRLG